MLRPLICAAALLCAVRVLAADPVAWPEGYRDWYHIKSMVIGEGHPLYSDFGGIHHVYANAEALQGYRGGTFPKGAVIVFDLLEAEADGQSLTEGARKVLAVMERDPVRFADTGGWGFEAFAGGDPDSRTVADKAAEACFGCHRAKADADFVFSELRP